MARVPAISAAQCLIVSQIGAPVSEPSLIQLKLAMHDSMPPEQVRSDVEELVAAYLTGIPRLSGDLVAGAINVY